MGGIFSRKKETTIEVLEGLQKRIEELESNRRDTELRQRRFIGTFVSYALVLYVAGIIGGYFYVAPSDAAEWSLLALPVVAFPSLIWLLKVLLSAWYLRKLSSNDDALLECREKRRKILDGVKEKETYKVASEILEKFDPNVKLEKAVKEREKDRKKEEDLIRRVGGSPAGLRQRKGGPGAPVDPTPTPQGQRQGMATPAQGLRPTFVTPGGPMPPNMTPRLARPLLPQERTTVDKFVDYLLGDGPNNRFALICTQCRGHNGMCLREEFEFCAFRCAFCGFFNPARAQRPAAPKLPPPTPLSGSQTSLDRPNLDAESHGQPKLDDESESTDAEPTQEEQSVEPEADAKEETTNA